MFTAVQSLFILILLLLLFSGRSQAQNNYSYDQQGRIIQDLGEEVDVIYWNNQNRITQVVHKNTSHNPDLEFFYDTNGNRITKITKPRDGNGLLPQNAWTYTYYVRTPIGDLVACYERQYEKTGASLYRENLTLLDQQLAIDQSIGYNQRLQPLAAYTFSAAIDPNGLFEEVTSLGVLFPVASNHDPIYCKLGNRLFPLFDNTQNVTAVFTDRINRADFTSYRADLLSSQQYYPFGMNLPERVYHANLFRFGFSGKESDDEWKGPGNSYDFGARMYDPRLGRWLSTDPLFNQYPSQSPYHYSLNSPMLMHDPDGKSAKITTIKNENGQGGKVIISADILISGANHRFIANYQKILNQYYQSSNFVDPTTGDIWKISFDLEVKAFTRDKLKNLNPDENLILTAFVPHPEDYTNHETRSNETFLYIEDYDLYTKKNYSKFNDDVFTMLHEVGHLLGLSDRYVEKVKYINERNAKHTPETLDDAEKGGIRGELMGGYSSKVAFHINQVHFENWAAYAINGFELEPNKKHTLFIDDNNIDQSNGKLTSPYLHPEYVRNSRAYWSIKRGEERRIQEARKLPAGF